MNQQVLKVVHFSDLHFGSGERYGTINSETGINKRFEDFMAALDKPIDFAISNNVDLVIFTGDTYKHATPEPIYQKEFAKRIQKLSKNNILTLMLVGNHDVLYRVDGSNALDIFTALDVNHVKVLSKISLNTYETNGKKLQVIALPHITKSKLLTKEDYRALSSSKQDDLLVTKVKESISGYIEQLDSNLPSILIGHGTLENASFGSEQDISIGKVLCYPISFFQNQNLDYVGFGHIHKYQILQEKSPLILYAGSLERVDFGEEKEDKGFIYFELSRGNISNYQYISTKPRPFLTIEVDTTLEAENNNIQKQIQDEIKKKTIKDSIIRLRFKIDESNLDLVDFNALKLLLKDSFSHVIQPEVVRKNRTYRMEELNTSIISDPILALDKYLYDKDEKEKEALIMKAKNLLREVNENN